MNKGGQDLYLEDPLNKEDVYETVFIETTSGMTF